MDQKIEELIHPSKKWMKKLSPLFGTIGSLNVSVAAAFLYEEEYRTKKLRKHRFKKKSK
jgi:hypothetical protein